MYYGVVVILLDESTDDTERGEAKVFERSCFGSRVQKRIQEKGYMCV